MTLHRSRDWKYAAAVICMLLLAGCGSTPKKAAPPTKPGAPSTTTTTPPASGKYYLDDGPGDNAPANVENIPDAVPKDEPLHRGANKPYTVFGKTYVPNVSTQPFRQEGVASWYGKKFHGQMTSNGETYDMYAMTAAHPTLPLPSYARVTNPANAKSVIVRVNDRGPFHSDRIIDLSYAAAAKLDLARKGSGPVIVERVFAGEVLTAAPPTAISIPTTKPPAALVATLPAAAAVVATPLVTSPSVSASASAPAPVPAPANIPPASTLVPDAGSFYLQLGAFGSMENAEAFRARMTREMDWNREPILVVYKDGVYRVRMGPYPSKGEADAIAAQVKASHDFSPIITKP